MIRMIRINLALSFYGNEDPAIYPRHPAGRVTRETWNFLTFLLGLESSSEEGTVGFGLIPICSYDIFDKGYSQSSC